MSTIPVQSVKVPEICSGMFLSNGHEILHIDYSDDGDYNITFEGWHADASPRQYTLEYSSHAFLRVRII